MTIPKTSEPIGNKSESIVSPNTNLYNNLSFSETKDLNYKQFIINISQIIRQGLGGNIPYEDLGINQLKLTLPKGILDRNELQNLKQMPSYEWRTQESNLEININLTREKLLKMKPQLPAHYFVSEELQKGLNIMSEFFLFFFSLDGEHHSNAGMKEQSQLINISENNVSLKKEREGNITKHILRFTRSYKGKNYYLELYFLGEAGTTQIWSNYVGYKDNKWYKGEGYGPNGSASRRRTHIGGDKDKAKSYGYTGTEIDSSISRLGEYFESQPELIGRGMRILAQGEADSELYLTLASPEVISPIQKGISRSDSWKEDHYKKIHPLSEQYYKEFGSIGIKNNSP